MAVVVDWELVTLAQWRNPCQGGGAGSGAGSGLPLVIVWRSCTIPLGALSGELVSSESGKICLGKIM